MAKEIQSEVGPVYMPSQEEAKERDQAYTYLSNMRDLKQQVFPHFSGQDGDRSWLTMLDDSERILNGYTMSREAQGKEEWQSNMLDNIARAKLKAIVAGTALKVPDMEIGAHNKNGIHSRERAEVLKNINKQTFEANNPVLHTFQQVWHMLSHGTVFEFEGYKTGGAKRDRIKSFDSLTGQVETEREYVKMDAEPFSVILNPQEFYWWDMFVRDVQDQQRVAWVQHYTKSEIEEEFSKYKNYKYIKNKKQSMHLSQLQETTFYQKWASRVEDENDYEVFRLFDKERDRYEIWVHGVPLLSAPLLWGDKEKIYPFGKQIAEPYANTNFFVGMPFGQIIEAYQEHKNTVINTMIDKLYRSMKKPYLYGLQNKDVLDYADKFIDEDNRFYVPDISQAKPFPYEGLNQGEFNMLAVLDNGIEMLSVDRTQQGMSPTEDRTATATALADRRAREMKGMLYNSLEDLWLQKTNLRTEIVISHYLQDKAAGETKKDQIISVEDYTFGDGDRGMLDIHIAKNRADLMPRAEIEARESAMEEEGIAYKLISVTKDWLNEWEYDIKIVPLSFHQQDKIVEEEDLMKELQTVASLFPEFFVANKQIYLKELLALRGKHPQEFRKPPQRAPQTPQNAPQGAGGGGAPQPPQPSPEGAAGGVLGLPSE